MKIHDMKRANRKCRFFTSLIVVIVLILTAEANSQEIGLIDTAGFAVLLEKLYRNHPELKIKQENVEQQKEEIVQAKMNFLNNLTLGFQFYQSPPIYTYEYDRSGISPHFGLTIGLNFESLLTTPSKIRQSKARLRAAEEEYIETRSQLKRQLFERFVAFKGAMQTYQLHLEKYRVIETHFNILQKKFENGEVLYKEFVDALREKAIAQEDLLDAEIKLKAAKARLSEMLER